MFTVKAATTLRAGRLAVRVSLLGTDTFLSSQRPDSLWDPPSRVYSERKRTFHREQDGRVTTLNILLYLMRRIRINGAVTPPPYRSPCRSASFSTGKALPLPISYGSQRG